MARCTRACDITATGSALPVPGFSGNLMVTAARRKVDYAHAAMCAAHTSESTAVKGSVVVRIV
ncbi:MAG: hypothetical protein H6661_07025 [Ardenticatenaceae bacterium]|nr:hypothetical protein [Ardenticatenaceae bacterium]